jgi:hypothetical protein
LLEADQSGTNRATDVETATRAAQVSFPVPAHVPRQLIHGIEPARFDQTLGKAEGHRSVIGPLARFQMKPSAANDLDYRRKRPAR